MPAERGVRTGKTTVSSLLERNLGFATDYEAQLAKLGDLRAQPRGISAHASPVTNSSGSGAEQPSKLRAYLKRLAV